MAGREGHPRASTPRGVGQPDAGRATRAIPGFVVLLLALCAACGPEPGARGDGAAPSSPPASAAPGGSGAPADAGAAAGPTPPADTPSAPGEPAGGAGELTAVERIWSEEGLDAQPRLDAYRARIPPGLGWTPRATAWRPAGPALAARLAGIPPAGTPGAVVAAVQAALEESGALGFDVWETTSRLLVRGDDAATAVVLRWGFQDDALAGHDVRVELRRGAAGWTVESSWERYQCRRGVSDEGLCL